jgi:phenylalanyl-tRNA synthetase beta chain
LRLSLNWLCDYADFNKIPFETIFEKISLSICEVDEVEEYKQELELIKAVQILKLEKHTGADNLWVSLVTDGKSEHTVVTGAKNLKVGDLVPLAIPGAVIEGKSIQKSEVKGILSFGMFCSERELGISEDHSGVCVLDSRSNLGSTLRELLKLEDKILLIDNKSITHRPDLWSHFGFARELAAQLDLPIKYNPYESKCSFSDASQLNVLENENVLAYFACEIKGIKVTESHRAIKQRLEKCGLRPISNVVDISNYVMLEMGQPTHFFDKDKLGDILISVERGHKSEFFCLDGEKRNLDPDALIITNQGKPVAIAGIIGGAETEVSEQTTNLILESAVFSREDIRKGIRKMGLRTEAAIRYEKGLESTTAFPVLLRSIELLKENGCPDLQATQPVGFDRLSDKKQTIELDLDFLSKKLGKEFPDLEVKNILSKLGFTVQQKGRVLDLLVPKYRHNYDITLPEDIVEEVGRSVGYAEVGVKPLEMEVVPALLQDTRDLERKMKKIFALELGFSEVYNYSFAGQEDVHFEKDEHPLRIVNQMPEESRYLRTSIYPSILESLRKNLDRFEECKVFELGRTYHKAQGRLGYEKKFLGFGFFRNHKQEALSELEKDLLEIRSGLEKFFYRLNLVDLELKIIERNYLHPKTSLGFFRNKELLAELGFLHPVFQKKRDFKKRLILGKILFEPVFEAFQEEKRNFRFQIPSQFPGAHLDISLIMDDAESTDRYAKGLKAKGIPELYDVFVHAIYRGEGLEPGKKSVTFRAELLNYQNTFNQSRIQEINEDLLSVAKESGYSLR